MKIQEIWKESKNLNLLELENLSERRESLCLQFAKKCLKNEKMKDLFHENQKTHQMMTRCAEKFDVKNTRTERLKRSPIFYLQRLLNDDAS